jgi:hypothetical protein
VVVGLGGVEVVVVTTGDVVDCAIFDEVVVVASVVVGPTVVCTVVVVVVASVVVVGATVVVAVPSPATDVLVIGCSGCESLTARTGARATNVAEQPTRATSQNHRTCRSRTAIADLPRRSNVNRTAETSQRISVRD